MSSRMFLKRAILFVITCLLISSPAFADTLVMKNGDTITGNISKIVDDEVYIEPSYADEFAVDLAEVVSIEAEQMFEIELDDGTKMDATLAGGKDGKQVLLVDGQTTEIEMTAFAEASEPEDWYDRESHIDLNMTWNEGNTVSRNNLLYADTRLKLGDHRHIAELTIRRDSTDGIDTKKQDLLSYQYNWFFDEPWYGGIKASWERDPIKDLDHRYILGVTLGRDIFDDARKFLTMNIGAGYSEEQYRATAESGATGLWNLIYEHDFREGDLTFFHNHNIGYQFFGDNNTIIKTNTGFRFDIIGDVYTNMSLRWDYETEPPIGAENEDVTLAVGIGAEF